jgi:hypothetical protein
VEPTSRPHPDWQTVGPAKSSDASVRPVQELLLRPDGFEGGAVGNHHRPAEMAKETIRAQLARLAALTCFKSIGTAHFRLLLLRFSEIAAWRHRRNAGSGANPSGTERLPSDRSHARVVFPWHRQKPHRGDRDAIALNQAKEPENPKCD